MLLSPHLFSLFYVFHSVLGHGVLNEPNQRGSLLASRYIPHGVESSIKLIRDGRPHFPAGTKAKRPGSALDSQIAALQGQKWKPFEPTRRDFRWFSGVCGDLKDNPQHLRPSLRTLPGEKNYYNGGKIVAKYKLGQVINVGITIVAHHNGFIELHLCDVARCRNKEISESCFRQGHCHQLQRSPNEKCDQKTSRRCGPIDPDYPGRWYLPCSRMSITGKDFEFFGGKERTILYQLPPKLECEHCVLQWYMAAANACSPPGVKEYFENNRTKPNWGRCKGQNGAIGGYTKLAKECGSTRRRQHYSEQYLQCADIQIIGDRKNETDGRSPSNPSVAPNEKSPYRPSKGRTQSSGAIRDIVLIGDKKRIMSLHSVSEVDVSRFKEISIEAYTGPMQRNVKIKKVSFRVNGRLVSEHSKRPFYIFGKANVGAKAWDTVPLNKKLRLQVYGGGDLDTTNVMFRGSFRK